MKRKHSRHQKNQYLSYVWVFAVGLTVLYSFSLMPRPTGLATAIPNICTEYFNDEVCDDSPEDCGYMYQPDTSLQTCEECQTGGFDCEYK